MKSTEKKELSYFRLKLETYLNEHFPEMLGNNPFITARSDEALTAYCDAVAQGFSHLMERIRIEPTSRVDLGDITRHESGQTSLCVIAVILLLLYFKDEIKHRFTENNSKIGSRRRFGIGR